MRLPLSVTMRRFLPLVLLAGCTQPLKLTKDDSPVVLAHQLISAPNPGEKGSLAVHTLCLHGDDPRAAGRAEAIRRALVGAGLRVAALASWLPT